MASDYNRLCLLKIVQAGLLLLVVSTASADPVKLRVGWVLTPPELPPVLFAEPGIAKHLGTSYGYEAVHFTSSSLIVTALATGDVDISPLTVFTVAAAIQNAKIEDLRILADEFQDGVDGYFSQEFMVRKDSGIARIEDLKGKVFGTAGIGSIGDIAVRVMLRRHGLSDKRDYSVVEAQSANLVPMLAAGKVDLITAGGLLYFDPHLQSIARPLFALKDVYGTTQASVFVSRAGFIAKNRPAVVDFFEDMLRSAHWYADPANRAQAAQIIARATKLPPERFESWIFTHDDMYRDPNGLPDLDALQRTFGIVKDAGLLTGDIDAKTYADLSLIREAGARLK